MPIRQRRMRWRSNITACSVSAARVASAHPRTLSPAATASAADSISTQARSAGLVTKSNLILGMGEEPHEVVETMQALHEAGCDLLTITQYLRPSVRHHPVVRWVKPDEFVGFREEAETIGFAGVLAGPLVRSSYRAGRLYQQAIEARGVTASA